MSEATEAPPVGRAPDAGVDTALSERPRRRRRRWLLPEKGLKPLLLLPVVVWILLVLEGPFLVALDRSLRFYDLADPTQGGQWAGLEQYVKLMHDSQFFQSLFITIQFMIPAVVLEIGFGIALALFFYQTIRNRPILSRVVLTLFLIPLMASEAVTALTWKFLLQSDFGVLSFFLKKVGVGRDISLLSNPDAVLPVVIMVDIWQWVPFVTLITFAGLMALPREPIEAAECDGASFFQRVRYVMLPPLWPLISIVVLFRAIDAFKIFDKVLILTGGGPGGKTEVLSLYAWRQGFIFSDQAYASAIVMFMFVFVIVAVEIWFKFVYARAQE